MKYIISHLSPLLRLARHNQKAEELKIRTFQILFHFGETDLCSTLHTCMGSIELLIAEHHSIRRSI